MKPIVLLILGCVPLSFLTVESFLETASVRDRFPRPPDGQEAAAAGDLGARTRARAEAETPLVAGVVGSDLFGARAMRALENVAADSRWKPLAADWPQWMAVCQMVDGFLETQRPRRGPAAENLQAALKGLSDWKKTYQAKLPRESRDLIEIADVQAAALDGRIAHDTQAAQFTRLLDRARAALRAGQFPQCAALCDQLLSDQYKAVIDADTADKLGVLRRRARFRQEYDQFLASLAEADSPPRRTELLRKFLDDHTAIEDPSPSEQEMLAKLRSELSGIRKQAAKAKLNTEGIQAAAHLEQNPPQSLAARLDQAARIVGRYPASTVRARLQADVRRWIEEFLAEKRVHDPLGLEEAETRQGEILRGYFRTVKDGGTIIGYERYRTAEELQHPRSAVGMLPKEGLATGPGKPLLARLAERYNAARADVLAQPDQPDPWERLAALCRDLDSQATAYRIKPGNSGQEISFGWEATFCSQFAAGSPWSGLQAVFGP